MSRLNRDTRVAICVGLAGVALSVARVDSYDEVYWGVMAERMLAVGDLPYFDMIDNKGPLHYLVMSLAVLLPGPLSAGVSAIYGLTLAGLFLRLTMCSQSVGNTSKQAMLWAGMATASAAALSTGALTTELIAAALAVSAFAARNTHGACRRVFAAALVDPRAAILAVPALWRLVSSRRFTPRDLLPWTIGAISLGVLVAVVPPIRLSLIDASIGTRVEPDWERLGFLALLAVAPFVVAIVSASHRRVEKWVVGFVVTGFVIGLVSGVGVSHYWIYTPLGLALVRWESSFHGALTALAATAAIGALVPLLASEVRVDASITARTGAIASEVAHYVTPDDQVLVWSQFPHMRAPYAAQTIGLAATSNIYGWPIGTHPRVLGGLQADLADASLIVVEETLDLDGLRAAAHRAALAVKATVSSGRCERIDSAPIPTYRCSTSK